MKHDDNTIIEAIKSSYGYAEVMRKLGYKINGGRHRMLKNFVQLNSIDTSHFTGSGHLKGKTHNWCNNKIPLKDLLVNPCVYGSSKLRKRLIKENILEEKCAECNVSKLWNNKPLTLQLDHINGNPLDNTIDNLRLLCPNCHSQTNTYGSKNRVKINKFQLKTDTFTK